MRIPNYQPTPSDRKAVLPTQEEYFAKAIIDSIITETLTETVSSSTPLYQFLHMESPIFVFLSKEAASLGELTCRKLGKAESVCKHPYDLHQGWPHEPQAVGVLLRLGAKYAFDGSLFLRPEWTDMQETITDLEATDIQGMLSL